MTSLTIENQENLKRFAHTEEAGDNLVAFVAALVKEAQVEACIDELENHFYPTDMWLYTDESDPDYPNTHSKPVHTRIEELKGSGGDK